MPKYKNTLDKTGKANKIHKLERIEPLVIEEKRKADEGEECKLREA
jgi:hypothetical protein